MNTVHPILLEIRDEKIPLFFSPPEPMVNFLFVPVLTGFWMAVWFLTPCMEQPVKMGGGVAHVKGYEDLDIQVVNSFT